MNSAIDERSLAAVALVALALFLGIAGWMQLRQGLELVRRGEAHHRFANRPLTSMEYRLAVGVLILTGVLGLGGAALVAWVLVAAY
jgi:hypothetical protein